MQTQAAENTKQLEVFAREAIPSDLAYVLSTWGVSYFRLLGPHTIDRGTFDAEHRRLATKLLNRSDIRILASRNPSGIVSFAVVDKYEPVIHYAHTALAERQKGHIRYLLSDLLDEPFQYTFDTALARHAARALKITYNPFLLTRLEL